MAHWEGNKLMHNWYGSKQADCVGIIRENKNKQKKQSFVFVAETIDDCFIKYYYEKPNAEEIFAAFINWQGATL